MWKKPFFYYWDAREIRSMGGWNRAHQVGRASPEEYQPLATIIPDWRYSRLVANVIITIFGQFLAISIPFS
jgi:hypothetical protein